VKIILIADNSLPFTDRLTSWLKQDHHVYCACNLTEYSQFTSPPAEPDLIIVGYVGPGASYITQYLAQSGKHLLKLTMDGERPIPGVTSLSRTCTEAELLDKVRELLQGATQ
jgi:hypothetical protein